MICSRGWTTRATSRVRPRARSPGSFRPRERPLTPTPANAPPSRPPFSRSTRSDRSREPARVPPPPRRARPLARVASRPSLLRVLPPLTSPSASLRAVSPHISPRGDVRGDRDPDGGQGRRARARLVRGRGRLRRPRGRPPGPPRRARRARGGGRAEGRARRGARRGHRPADADLDALIDEELALRNAAKPPETVCANGLKALVHLSRSKPARAVIAAAGCVRPACRLLDPSVFSDEIAAQAAMVVINCCTGPLEAAQAARRVVVDHPTALESLVRSMNDLGAESPHAHRAAHVLKLVSDEEGCDE